MANAADTLQRPRKVGSRADPSGVPKRHPVEYWIERLQSLHDGDQAVAEFTAYGETAIPPLRNLLFEREPSGIFEPRCRAVDALAALRAFDVLIEYLEGSTEIADPVEAAGEEAVMNAAARALAADGSERVFQVLVSIARRRLLAGVIETLGSFRRPEATPCFVAGLAEDFARPAAEACLRGLGRVAYAALIETATVPVPSAEGESVSSLRRRRSALRLLNETGLKALDRGKVRVLMRHHDPWIRVLACKMVLNGDAADRREAMRRLLETSPNADVVLSNEIDACLHEHSGKSAGGR